jgi:hypothetical protein
MQQMPRSKSRTLARTSPVASDRTERALDAALEATFPASDPIAVFLGDSLPSPDTRRHSVAGPSDPDARSAMKPRPAPEGGR